MKIKEKDIYNIDETRFSIRTIESTWVIIDSILRIQYEVYPGR